MFNTTINFKNALIFLLAGTIMIACKKKEEEHTHTESKPALRDEIKYSTLVAGTLYDTAFVDENGDSTVDRREGHLRLQMFRGINAYVGTSVNAMTAIDASVYEGMFANYGNSFTGIYAGLNSSTLQLRNVVASSMSYEEQQDVYAFFSEAFQRIDRASDFIDDTVTLPNVPGKIFNGTSKYLVDSMGIEQGQIIQKGLIGALQLDYIGNVLLGKCLQVDNTYLVPGTNYTQREHNWDVAYGMLTNRRTYGSAAGTSSGEFALGSYVWEYNPDGFAELHDAFVKGRAAVVNNDNDVVTAQVKKIRNIFETAIANAAVGYMNKFKTGVNDGARVHAVGEGYGFVYSLRFCKMNNADAEYSDEIIDVLGLTEGNGFWDLDEDKANAAINMIGSKFDLLP